MLTQEPRVASSYLASTLAGLFMICAAGQASRGEDAPAQRAPGNPPEPAARTPVAPIAVTADQFVKEFQNSREDWKTKYLGKVVHMSGKVGNMSDVQYGRVWLASSSSSRGISCEFRQEEYLRWYGLAVGQEVVVANRIRNSESGATLIKVGEDTANSLTAAELTQQIEADPQATAKKYGQQTMQITGEVARIAETSTSTGTKDTEVFWRYLHVDLKGHTRDSDKPAAVKLVFDVSGPTRDLKVQPITPYHLKVGDHIVIRAEMSARDPKHPLKLSDPRILKRTAAATK